MSLILSVYLESIAISDFASLLKQNFMKINSTSIIYKQISRTSEHHIDHLGRANSSTATVLEVERSCNSGELGAYNALLVNARILKIRCAKRETSLELRNEPVVFRVPKRARVFLPPLSRAHAHTTGSQDYFATT